MLSILLDRETSMGSDLSWRWSPEHYRDRLRRCGRPYRAQVLVPHLIVNQTQVRLEDVDTRSASKPFIDSRTHGSKIPGKNVKSLSLETYFFKFGNTHTRIRNLCNLWIASSDEWAGTLAWWNNALLFAYCGRFVCILFFNRSIRYIGNSRSSWFCLSKNSQKELCSGHYSPDYVCFFGRIDPLSPGSNHVADWLFYWWIDVTSIVTNLRKLRRNCSKLDSK